MDGLLTGNSGFLGHTINTTLPTAGEAMAGPMGLVLGGGLSAARYGAGSVVGRGQGMVMNALAQKLTDADAFRKAVNPLAVSSR